MLPNGEPHARFIPSIHDFEPSEHLFESIYVMTLDLSNLLLRGDQEAQYRPAVRLRNDFERLRTQIPLSRYTP
jgi:hypothetical protein